MKNIFETAWVFSQPCVLNTSHTIDHAQEIVNATRTQSFTWLFIQLFTLFLHVVVNAIF